jgi:type IV pilus assembly protein PilA
MKRFIAKVAKFYKGGEKGFTLIELLIVIVILGVLAAAIIPNLSKFMGSGVVGAANAELASVRTAVAAYQADNNALLPLATPALPPAIGNIDNTAIQEYMAGKNVVGTYDIDVNGIIRGQAGTYDGSLTWDNTNLKWAK